MLCYKQVRKQNKKRKMVYRQIIETEMDKFRLISSIGLYVCWIPVADFTQSTVFYPVFSVCVERVGGRGDVTR